ncbi:UDP-4-amino-4,6-dideoxy-N-acetyl-beta-L-altrosamine transaminase [Candidatus Pseudothioglobus singularis]|nr:UDP-4-amino-4,6-dideoxy-N-acetyl-beta-L-altrosamine transaminase [Candidatus Pseudothioglobus singularis]
MIPYGCQDINESDISAVLDVLRSDYLTQGPVVPKFEHAVSSYCGASHGIAMNSATSALHVACLSLGLGPGDWVWTSANTFVASANCGRYCGANVDFVDICPKTYNLSIRELEKKLEKAKSIGKLPKVVIPVHFSGQPCDMPKLHALAQYYGFKIIEDASHAIGARYNKNFIGSCIHSDITVFSFHPVKIITTGEGGLATTNNPELAERMLLFRSHGITRDSNKMTIDSHGDWYYQQIGVGFNYRMTDIQAALGLSQLERLDEYIEQRDRIAQQYDKQLADLPVQLPLRISKNRPAFHLYPIQLVDSQVRSRVFQTMRDAGIGVNVHYIPVHTQPYYENLGFKTGDFPQAEAYYSRTISLPIFPAMSIKQQDHIIEALKFALVKENK